VRSVAWRDAGTVVAMADEGMATTVSAVDAATGARQVLVPAGGPAMWALSLSADGTRAAYVASTATRPWEVFGGALAGPLRALTDGNGWLDQRLLARQEVVRYKARDGLELEGVLIYPVSERAERRYPLVLVVHGGPEGNYKDGWMTNYGMPGQVAAGRGYAVFHPNYRGSTGRGVAFSKTSQGDPGGKEFDDLVDGVDHLVAAGLVDTARVGVTGGSYGGYATAWLATRYSERFAAGVMMVGISDKISKTGTTDIPEEELLVHARKRPWQDWQHFLERSPIYHADKGRTPLLVVHGARDPRVNPGQSLEMHRFLKLHGQAPVRLVLYPGEGHGNAKAAARLDYSLRQLRWLEHYLTHGRDAAKPPRRLRYEPPGSPTEKKGKATGAGHGKGKAR
jgi:dipeptidyl aminopeptidase/acylaminoacyl peptidase